MPRIFRIMKKDADDSPPLARQRQPWASDQAMSISTPKGL